MRKGHWAAPSLMQAIELALGVLPREYKSWDEVQGWHKDLLPTPVAHDDGKTPEAHLAMKARMGHGRKEITSLSVMAQTLLPTPQAHDAAGAKTPDQIAAGRAKGHGVANLNEAVLLPTPKANDGKGATITHGRFRPDGRPYGDGDANLPLRITELMPTPTAHDAEGRSMRAGGPGLPDVAILLPTPLSGEARHGSPGQHRTRGDKMLTGEVLGMLGEQTPLFSTPGAYDGERGGPQDPAKRRAGGHYVTLQDQACFDLLPSPMAADGDRGSLKFPRGNPTLKGALLPTPSVATATGGQTSRSGSRSDEKLLGGLAMDMAVEWGAYEPAIRRWEYIRGIEAPCPVEPGQKGRPRLAPPFVEWMMGLPPGWVTGIEGLSRAKQLKLLGNGVVPQQVYLALRTLLETLTLVS